MGHFSNAPVLRTAGTIRLTALIIQGTSQNGCDVRIQVGTRFSLRLAYVFGTAERKSGRIRQARFMRTSHGRLATGDQDEKHGDYYRDAYSGVVHRLTRVRLARYVHVSC